MGRPSLRQILAELDLGHRVKRTLIRLRLWVEVVKKELDL